MRGLYHPSSGADLVAHALNHEPGRPVIILDDGRVVTTGELRDSISRYVQLFATLSPRPLRAALLSKNRPEVPGGVLCVFFRRDRLDSAAPDGLAG